MALADDIIRDFTFYIDMHIINFEKYWLSHKHENIMAYNHEWNKYKVKYLK